LKARDVPLGRKKKRGVFTKKKKKESARRETINGPGETRSATTPRRHVKNIGELPGKNWCKHIDK